MAKIEVAKKLSTMGVKYAMTKDQIQLKHLKIKFQYEV